MSTEAMIAAGIAIGVVFGLTFFVVMVKNHQIRRLERRVWALELELRPLDGKTYHWQHKGQIRCGNDLPNISSTLIEAHVNCFDCRRLMNYDRGLAA